MTTCLSPAQEAAYWKLIRAVSKAMHDTDPAHLAAAHANDLASEYLDFSDDVAAAAHDMVKAVLLDRINNGTAPAFVIYRAPGEPYLF